MGAQKWLRIIGHLIGWLLADAFLTFFGLVAVGLGIGPTLTGFNYQQAVLLVGIQILVIILAFRDISTIVTSE
jgi:hypothetical protein